VTARLRAPLRRDLRAWFRRDDGVSALEAVILAPAVLAMLVLAIIAMRVEVATQAVDAAAHDAARAASLEHDGDTARKAAEDLVSARLGGSEHLCHDLHVNVDTSGFAVQIGQPAEVTVAITCVADFSDVAVPGMPGSTTIDAKFTSALDQFRGRTP